MKIQISKCNFKREYKKTNKKIDIKILQINKSKALQLKIIVIFLSPYKF